MSNLSNVIQNGQSLTVPAGTGAIAAQALVQIGGPGNEAWPVATIDRASVAPVSVITPISTSGGAVNNYARWGCEFDASGNAYVLSPNSSSQGVKVTKFSPAGVSLGSGVLDSTAHTMLSAKLVSLSNATWAAVYADASTGGVRFVIFDAGLSIIAGPTAVATGYVTGAVAYADACALSGGGFAVVYLNSGHSAITLQTYSNAGVAVLGATGVQAFSGSAALVYVRVAQLSTANLVVAMRTTETPAGTSFVIVTTGGASVVTNTVVDSTATAGFLSLSVVQGFGFAIGVMNGTDAIAAVYSNAGVAQGSAYSVANTLNNTTYMQFKVTNDGTNFYFAYIQTSGGLAFIQLTQAGASTISATGLLSSTFTTTTALDADICNNIAFVLAASAGTNGQNYVTLALPNSALGYVEPEVLSGPTAIGSAAATTGTYWPTVRAIGDFTAVVVYDHQSTADQLCGAVKFAASAIQGVAQNAVSVNSPGSSVTINPGPGSYPVVAMNGTNGSAFDHSGATPPGNRGALFSQGASLSAPATAQPVGNTSRTAFLFGWNGTPATYSYTAVGPVNLNVFISGGATTTVNGQPVYLNSTSQATYTLYLGAGQVFSISTGTSVGQISAAEVS